MRCACAQLNRVGVMIQIRNVPEDLHRKLKSRAALAGMSLSDYLLAEISESAQKPTLQEWAALVRNDPPTEFDVSPADMIREERERR
jgi:plasmid stability protein